MGTISEHEETELREELVKAIQEREQFRQHSMKLNHVAWRIAEALGYVHRGQTTPLDADIDAIVTELIERAAPATRLAALDARVAKLEHASTGTQPPRNPLKPQLTVQCQIQPGQRIDTQAFAARIGQTMTVRLPGDLSTDATVAGFEVTDDGQNLWLYLDIEVVDVIAETSTGEPLPEHLRDPLPDPVEYFRNRGA